MVNKLKLHGAGALRAGAVHWKRSMQARDAHD